MLKPQLLLQLHQRNLRQEAQQLNNKAAQQPSLPEQLINQTLIFGYKSKLHHSAAFISNQKYFLLMFVQQNTGHHRAQYSLVLPISTSVYIVLPTPVFWRIKYLSFKAFSSLQIYYVEDCFEVTQHFTKLLLIKFYFICASIALQVLGVLINRPLEY